jgi:hypothetical protein
MPRPCRATPAAAGLALVAVLVGCGGGDARGRVAFTQVEVQAFLEREVARTLPGLTVGAASCPADLPDRAGEMATCAVVVEQVTLQYEVQRLVADRFEARPQRPIVLVRDIATAVQSKLGAPMAQVQCAGAAVVQPAPDQPLRCQVTGAGPPRSAVVKVGADGALTVTDG